MIDRYDPEVAKLRSESERIKVERAQYQDLASSLQIKLNDANEAIDRLNGVVDKYKWQIRDTCYCAEKAEAELASGILLKEHGVDERPEQSGNYLCRASRCFDSIDYGKKEFKFIRFCVDSMKWETSWRILEWYELPAKEEGE
jgi:hypothetical protein